MLGTMSSDLTLDFGQHRNIMNNMDTEIMSINRDGEWDIGLFDELNDLVNADELLLALEHAGYNGDAPDLDFDIDLPPWNFADTGSTCTAHTLSSTPSPASMETLSPYSILDEAPSPLSQSSPASISSESSGFSEAPLPTKRPPKRTSQSARTKAGQPVRRPIQLCTKVSIQPRPVITALPLAHTAAPLQASTIIIQPLPTATVIPLGKPTPISIQPAPPAGRPVVLSQTGQMLHIQTPPPLVAMPMLRQDHPASVAAPSMVSVTVRSPSSDDDSKVCQRQQRMIKNRESASQSRKKKKEYLFTLETRLKLALSENEVLKNENGTLKKQLEGLLSENTVLKTTAPKRRAVCLMAVLLFLMLNVGPKSSLFQGGPGSKLQAGGSTLSGRHLLGFSPDAEPEVGPEPQASGITPLAESSEDKALMVVKDPVFHRRPVPCQPPVNRTKCAELTSELRGWVHRHEVEQTKSRRMSNSQHKPTRSFLKPEEKDADVAQIVTVQYTDSSEEKNSGSELQVYYAPHRTYSDFFDEMNRRGDTFYVVSFRRDHLLLPATSHNKGRRPKMSLVLPAININDSIIKDKEFEVMMQIDCEVTDTRILHIRTSTIPPVLRANRTDTLYPPSPAESQAVPPPVGVLMGSA